MHSIDTVGQSPIRRPGRWGKTPHKAERWLAMIKAAGWLIYTAGFTLWLYGYLSTQNIPPFLDWRNFSPWWIADFIPNVQAELGIALMLVGMIPIYWRHR